MNLAPILMNDFSRQWEDVGAEVLAAVERVGKSAWYVLGREVEAFEAALAQELGIDHALGCGNGLDAIEIGLRGLGLRPGQRVLTTPLSAFATSLAIVRAGGVPVFVDVDESGLVDLDLAQRAFEADATLRFFVPVHLFGHTLDLTRLAELRNRFELAIVEDACQAIGARSRGQAVGSVGQCGALSFYPTKNLGAFGDGGAVITNDASVAAQGRSLRDYGQSKKYVHDRIGLNSRLDELHAAVLKHALLPRLPVWTARRGEIAATYLAGIDNPLVRPLPIPEGSQSVWHLFPVRVEAVHRQAFVAHLSEAGVHSGIHYPKLITNQAALVTAETLSPLPLAAALASEEVSIPIHPYLTNAEAARVITAINSFRVT